MPILVKLIILSSLLLASVYCVARWPAHVMQTNRSMRSAAASICIDFNYVRYRFLVDYCDDDDDADGVTIRYVSCVAHPGGDDVDMTSRRTLSDKTLVSLEMRKATL